MDTDTLVDFISLAHTRSFSKAAKERNVTQPAFSRRIQALEIALGVTLVDRQNKGFRLTPAGERYLLHARKIIDLSNEAIEDARSLDTRLSRPVYISAPSYISKTFFPAWYKSMQALVPGLTVRVSIQRGSEAMAALKTGLADFALVLEVDKIPSCYRLGQVQSKVIGSDSVIAVRGRHLKKASDILMSDQNSYMSRCAEKVLGPIGKKGTVVFESSSTGLLKEMALAGFGVAVLPQSLVEDDLSQGYLEHAEGTHTFDAKITLTRAGKNTNAMAESLWQAATKASK